MQFYIRTSRPPHPWAESIAPVYSPLNWLSEHSILSRPLNAYWTFFDRDNFYVDDFKGDWAAIKYSRFGTIVRNALR
jgi:hypothetical protein